MLVERLRADGAGEPHIGGGAVVYRSMEHSGGGDSGGQCDVDYACPRTVCPGFEPRGRRRPRRRCAVCFICSYVVMYLVVYIYVRARR